MVGNRKNTAGGTGPDPLSGRVGNDADTGQSQQKGEGGSSSGHYTPTGRDGGIVNAPPESNVGPPGAPQSSRGSAGQSTPKKPGGDTR